MRRVLLSDRFARSACPRSRRPARGFGPRRPHRRRSAAGEARADPERGVVRPALGRGTLAQGAAAQPRDRTGRAPGHADPARDDARPRSPCDGRPLRPHVVQRGQGNPEFHVARPSHAAGSRRPTTRGTRCTRHSSAWSIAAPRPWRGSRACGSAGKTGTAQNPHGKDHALFVCYAPVEDPRIVLRVRDREQRPRRQHRRADGRPGHEQAVPARLGPAPARPARGARGHRGGGPWRLGSASGCRRSTCRWRSRHSVWSVIGLLTVYSATSIPGAHEGLWVKQLTWAVAAVFAAWFVAAIHYRVYDSLAYPIYGVALVFLVAVLVMGSSAYGAKRWLDLGPIQFQPSELAKIATVLVLARRFDDPKLDLTRVRHWLPAAMHHAGAVRARAQGARPRHRARVPGHPGRDVLLGRHAAASARARALAGVERRAVLRLGDAVVVRRPVRRAARAVPAAAAGDDRAAALERCGGLRGAASRNGLQDYQKRRIETFLDPGNDPYGAGYQIIQSQDRDRLGRDHGQGLSQGNAEGARVPAHATHRLHLLGGGRGAAG